MSGGWSLTRGLIGLGSLVGLACTPPPSSESESEQRAAEDGARTLDPYVPGLKGDATSPYLLQHAHNPVNWYPWGDEVFDRALRENKPVLLRSSVVLGRCSEEAALPPWHAALAAASMGGGPSQAGAAMARGVALVEQRPWVAAGFGLGAALLLAIPVLNLLFRPAVVVVVAASHVLGHLEPELPPLDQDPAPEAD